ncbi:MAG: glycosyltransferase family 4 protein [Bryobacteraceae bacterium]
MRILLTSNASYAPPRGGSTRSNLVWLRHLARNGHECRVVSAALPGADDVVTDSISIFPVQDFGRRSGVLANHIHEFQPDWVLVSSEDVSHMLLREAHQAAPERLVYLAHTPQFYPFGPASWNADNGASGIVRSARAVVAIGTHTAAYIERHLARAAVVIHPPIYGSPPYRQFGGFQRGTVLMINPCQVKGIDIFLALAKCFPAVSFTALAGWGTTTEDRIAMAAFRNVTVLDSVPDIDDVLSKASLLLMPSLWTEGFGLIAMEAMLRGLPVIASDSGGLVEAKQGTGYVIPVRPIERYGAGFDENHMPKAVRVAQDLEPWVDALRTLSTDKAAYEAEAAASRAAALRFVSGLDAADFEKMLLSLRPGALVAVEPKRPADLSPAKRALLLQRLRAR